MSQILKRCDSSSWKRNQVEKVMKISKSVIEVPFRIIRRDRYQDILSRDRLPNLRHRGEVTFCPTTNGHGP